MNSNANPATQGNIDDYKGTCVDQSITPIFPVRYSFADFELLETSLEYPSASKLISAKKTKSSGIARIDGAGIGTQTPFT